MTNIWVKYLKPTFIGSDSEMPLSATSLSEPDENALENVVSKMVANLSRPH